MKSKEELITTLYKEFDHDKEIIKENLLKMMDTIVLEVKSKNQRVILTLRYEEQISKKGEFQCRKTRK